MILLVFWVLIGISNAEEGDLTYKLKEGETFIYQLTTKGETAEGGYGEDESEWKKSNPPERTEEFSIQVMNVDEKADGRKICTIRFEVTGNKADLEKEIFDIRMTLKGLFIFKDDEEREKFVRIESIWRSLYAGLTFPRLSTEKVEEGKEFESPDLINAYDRDYNLTFSENNICVDKLKVSRVKKDANLLLLEGTKKSEFEKYNTRFKYDMKKSYVFDVEKGLITSGSFSMKIEAISLVKNFRPASGYGTYQVKLISMNGKKME